MFFKIQRTLSRLRWPLVWWANTVASAPQLHWEKVDVVGQRCLRRERNSASQFWLHIRNILGCEVDRHFDSHGDRIRLKHETLQRFMPAFVMGHGLQDEAGNAWCKVLLLGNFYAREVKCADAGGGPVLVLEERMRVRHGHLRKIRLKRLQCTVFGSTEESRELPAVDTVVVHLLVMEPGGADELVRP